MPLARAASGTHPVLRIVLIAASLSVAACADQVPRPSATPPAALPVHHFLEPPGVLPARPSIADTLKHVCSDPAQYPQRAFNTSQLSAADIKVLIKSPTTARELLSNLQVLQTHDLLVQEAFFEDDVLMTFFGAKEVVWEATERPLTHLNSPVAFGPNQLAHVRALKGGLSEITVRVISGRTCMGWHQMPFPPGAWWPPVTYHAGSIRIEISPPSLITVGLVRETFGPNPEEEESFFLEEFGGGVSFPPRITYVDHQKTLESEPFSNHSIQFIPDRPGNERPRPAGKYLFPDETNVVAIEVVQRERDL